MRRLHCCISRELFDLPYICAGYNITNYFWSQATAKKQPKTQMLRRLRVEFLEKGSCEDHQISHGCRG